MSIFLSVLNHVYGLGFLTVLPLTSRFLRMNDFDMTISKDMFLNYLKWRKEFRVDMIHKVN